MLDIVNAFKSLIKQEQIHIDNNVFKLHYKFTVIMLVVFSILLSSMYFGDPISCHVHEEHMKIIKHINMLCWITETFIVDTGNEPLEHPSKYPGIANEEEYGNKRIWQSYYQWVCLSFSFQALLFYVPRYIWKMWEGGRLRLILKDLSGPIVSPTWNDEINEKLILHLVNGGSSHNQYAFRFVVCEILNLINVIFQIFFTDWYLNGRFWFYGIDALNKTYQLPKFPTMTKCLYEPTGSAGSNEKYDALCLLPLNVLNDKFFLVLWFWLYILGALTLFSLIYRFLVIFSYKLRASILVGHSCYIPLKLSYALVMSVTYGDFFILDHIGKNVNPIVFSDIIRKILAFVENRAKNDDLGIIV